MWQLRLRRLAYRGRVAGTDLERCWQTPLPVTGRDWRQVSFLVVDAEMSSLDVNKGELLSVGWVAVEGGAIALDSAPIDGLQNCLAVDRDPQKVIQDPQRDVSPTGLRVRNILGRQHRFKAAIVPHKPDIGWRNMQAVCAVT